MSKNGFRLALVTGASSGIGRELAILLAGKGINLIITGRNTNALDALAVDLRKTVVVDIFPADLSNRIERGYLLNFMVKRAPDLVINNAGFGFYGPVIVHSTEEMVNMLEVNAAALMEISVEACRMWAGKKMKGVVLNVSSVAAFYSFPLFAVYAATKAFVNSFSAALDYEMRDRGIRVLAACPGMVSTNFAKRAGKGKNRCSKMSAAFAAREIWRQIVSKKPIKVFNWQYRLTLFLSRYLLPGKLVMWFLRRVMSKRIVN